MPELAAVIPSLSVVIPAYNAADQVCLTICAVCDWLTSQAIVHEVIVVDDGSSDSTGYVAAALGGVRVLRNEVNRGKGFSVRRGVLAAQHEWVLFMDVDHSTRIEELERFAAAVEGGAEIVIASRRVAGARIVRRQPKIRQAMGRTFPYLTRLLALPGIRDTQCGFKLFRRDAAHAIFSRLRTERFAFDVEALLLARKLGYRIVEAPIAWNNPPGSTLRVGPDSAQMFWDLIKIAARLRWNWGGENVGTWERGKG